MSTLNRVLAATVLLLAIDVSLGEEQGESTHHGFPHHVVGIFLGDTTEDRRDGLTLGLEYEYRISEPFGIGVIFEHVSGDFDTNVYVLPVAMHRGPWKMYAGPGLESSEEGEEPLFRIGVEYGFEIGNYELSPQIDIDFVDGDQLFIFGLTLAKPF